MTRLDDELSYYHVFSGLLDEVRQRIDRNPHDRRLTELGFPLKRAKKDPRAELKSYIDELQKALDETFLLRLVAAFESMAFDRASTALGEARRAVTENFPPNRPFSRAAQKFVRNDLNDLRGIEDCSLPIPTVPAKDSEGCESTETT